MNINFDIISVLIFLPLISALFILPLKVKNNLPNSFLTLVDNNLVFNPDIMNYKNIKDISPNFKYHNKLIIKENIFSLVFLILKNLNKKVSKKY